MSWHTFCFELNWEQPKQPTAPQARKLAPSADQARELGSVTTSPTPTTTRNVTQPMKVRNWAPILVLLATLIAVARGATPVAVHQAILQTLATRLLLDPATPYKNWNPGTANDACGVWAGVVCDAGGFVETLYVASWPWFRLFYVRVWRKLVQPDELQLLPTILICQIFVVWASDPTARFRLLSLRLSADSPFF